MLGRRASRLAPPRHIARGGSPPARCVSLSPRAPRCAPHSCPVAVGRDGRPPGLPARTAAPGGEPFSPVSGYAIPFCNFREMAQTQNTACEKDVAFV